MAKKTFEQWFKEVDLKVKERTGMSVRDLPDCCYQDWYEDGVSPKGAASRAIKNAREG